MELQELLAQWQRGSGRLVLLTGAGVSAESGIPTFRGQGGFWRVGSQNYTPMDLATRAMFEREPETVWCWYLSRFAACAKAEPNAAHRAIALIQSTHGDRVTLVTQNVDGLHQRAGSPPERSYAIHGDARLVRCSGACTNALEPMPAVAPPDAANRLSAEARSRLQCARCGEWLRPHVLWFDEWYNEEFYRSDSAMAAVCGAALLMTVGTTGTTGLPDRMGEESKRRLIPIIDVNLEDNPFSKLAQKNGVSVRESAGVAMPRIAGLLGVDDLVRLHAPRAALIRSADD